MGNSNCAHPSAASVASVTLLTKHLVACELVSVVALTQCVVESVCESLIICLRLHVARLFERVRKDFSPPVVYFSLPR